MVGTSVEEFDGAADVWNQALAGLSGRTYCHLFEWGSAIRDSFGHEVVRLAARDEDGSIVGLLPLVRMKSPLFGHHLISLPFLNYGGPVGAPPVCVALAEHAATLADESGAQLELRCRTPLDLEHPASLGKVTVLLPLPGDSEELWTKGLKAKVRSQVRRPMKAGMTATFGSEHLGDFYRVWAHNMRDLGTPVLPLRFFESVRSHLEDQMILCAVHAGDEVVAAGLGFLFEDEFELTWASSSRQHAREAPNMLLYWSLMEEVIRRGGTCFNFGRCTPGSGTHRFKLQWGSVDQQLHWYRWPASETTEAPRESGVFKKATDVWKRLPLSVANRLGPMVSGSIPSW